MRSSTRMPRSGLPRVFVHALACTSMQTFGGRCRCTSSVRSTQTASSQQHSPQLSACLWRARKGMRSGPAPSSLPRGAVAGVAAAPAPPGVCATGRGVAAPPLLLVANIVLFRVEVCGRGSKSALVGFRHAESLSPPGTNFRYRREPPSNFRVCPLFGKPPSIGAPGELEKPPKSDSFCFLILNQKTYTDSRQGAAEDCIFRSCSENAVRRRLACGCPGSDSPAARDLVHPTTAPSSTMWAGIPRATSINGPPSR